MKIWTDWKIARLKELWLSGMSASQCARAIGGGITRSAVIGKVHRLGIAEREMTQTMKSSSILKRIRAKNTANAKRPPRKVIQADLSRVATTIPDDPMPAVLMPLTELEDHHCRWVYGDPRSSHGFCGHEVIPGGSYCPKHAAVVYTIIEPKRQKREVCT